MLHFSSFLGTLLYMGATLIIYYSIGYVVLNKMIRTKLRDYGTFVSLPMYLSAGIILLTFILYPIGILIFNSLIVYLVPTAIIAYVLGKKLISARTPTAANEKSLSEKPGKIDRKRLDDVVAGVVFAISLLYVTIFMAIAKWPPPGDLINHGFYTSLIIYDQRIPTTFYPFIDAPFRYPLGFHINSAFLTILLGIYPAESVFLFGGVLMITLTSLVFTLTYLMTRSGILSVLSYLLLYLVYPSGTMDKWLFGYLFNGTYPNIYGFMVVLFSVAAVAIHAKVKDNYILLRLFPILMIALLLTYPSFVFVPFILFIAVAFQTGIRKLIRICVGNQRNTLITLFLAISSVGACLYVFFKVFLAHVERGGLISAWYAASEDYLFNSLFGYSMIMASILSTLLILFSLFKANKLSPSLTESTGFVELRPIVITYVLFDLALLLSLNPYFFSFLQYFLPDRLTVLIFILSVVVNIYALSKIIDIFTEKLRNSFVKKSFTANKMKVVMGLTFNLCFLGTLAVLLLLIPQISDLLEHASSDWLAMFVLILSLVLDVYAIMKVLGIVMEKLSGSALKKRLPVNRRNMLVGLTVFLFFNASGFMIYSLSSHATLQLANGSAWYSNNPSFEDDSRALEWVHGNVKSGELILNDFSWSGLFLLSLSIKNVSMNYLLRGLGRAEDLQNIWLHPDDATLVHSLVKEYNVSYILVTSELGFYDYLGSSRYTPKPYSPTEYVLMFYTYDFLELVFRSGGSAIFRVK